MKPVNYFKEIMKNRQTRDYLASIDYFQSETRAVIRRGDKEWHYQLYEKESGHIAVTYPWIVDCALFQYKRPNNGDMFMFQVKMEHAEFIFQFFTSSIESRSIIPVSYDPYEGYDFESEKYTQQDRDGFEAMLTTVEEMIKELPPFRLVFLTQEIRFDDEMVRLAIQNQDLEVPDL